MGLDIVAYSRMEPDESGDVRCYAAYGFTDRILGLENGGSYRLSPNSKTVRQCIGSYSYYNHWRNQLAQLAGYESAKACWNEASSGPFYELIDFSDCDGCIGPYHSMKLFADFQKFEEKAANIGGDFFKVYTIFHKAFDCARDGGMVIFR